MITVPSFARRAQLRRAGWAWCSAGTGRVAAVDGEAGGDRHATSHPARHRCWSADGGLHDRRRGGAQVARHDRRAVPRVRPIRPHPQRRRDRRGRRHGHRRRRVCRCFMAPRRSRGTRLHHARRDGRRRHRRQDRRQPRRRRWDRRQEPDRRVLAAGRRRLRSRCAGHAAATRGPLRSWRDGQVPLPHRRRPAGDGRGRAHRQMRGDQGRLRVERRARIRSPGAC